jgi:hypothetical protein
VFTIQDRRRVRHHLIDMARADPRIVAGAEVGSLTQTTGDRWSDVDLTFGVCTQGDVDAVLRDWTERLETQHGAVRLFDLASMETIYRVFLFPGCLQVDISLTAGAVAQMGPKFSLLFGTAVDHVSPPALDPREVFGLCVHHALRSRFGIERARLWSAQYYIAELRHETLSLACLRRDLPGRYARGFDELPAELLTEASGSLVRSLEPAELVRALRSAIRLLTREARDLDTFPLVEPSLHDLTVDALDSKPRRNR